SLLLLCLRFSLLLFHSSSFFFFIATSSSYLYTLSLHDALPIFLLMDEPTSALDPISTSKIEDLIHELKKEYTIVIVTHNMQQAARVSDKTGYFYLGELVEYGETRKIFTNPEKESTQNYITGRFG